MLSTSMNPIRNLVQAHTILARFISSQCSAVGNGITLEDRENIVAICAGIISRERRFLSEGITLIESRSQSKRVLANLLLSRLQEHLSGREASMRIGLSGPPGAGKSTFIDSLGCHLVSEGRRVAVLAVDPSSHETGGALLGDKTRMVRLARHPHAYIRPSPSSGCLGGVTATSHSAITLCEAAGYDVILVETVGAGQSDIAVSQVTDCFTLVIPPGSGDELQGLKRGIMEMADIVVVNKADGELLPAARRVKSQYLAALRILKPKPSGWKPVSLLVSSKEGRGIDTVWGRIEECWGYMKNSGWLDRRRGEQRVELMQSHLQHYLSELIASGRFQSHFNRLEAEVKSGQLPPSTAASQIIQSFQLLIESQTK